MGDKSAIEWTDATWNPVRGCAIVSKGCTNCYAMRQAHRSSGAGGAYEGLTRLTNGGPVWTGEVRTVPELLDQPGRWKRPRRIFVNSMSDLFHADVPDDFIGEIWRRMAWNPQHVFQILTKRPRRMLAWLLEHSANDVFAGEETEYQASIKAHGWPLRNVWLGVSVEDQLSADERIPLLLQAPAAVRWISAEPLLGPISFEGCWVEHPNPAVHVNWLEELDWVVVGGESGPGARPMHPDWARALRDQCAVFGVAFFFKQWGAWAPIGKEPQTAAAGLTNTQPGETQGYELVERFRVRCEAVEWSPSGIRSLRLGKKRAGRELDGRTHDEYPS